MHDKAGTFVEVDKTSTWCTQLGCRLQWYGKEKNTVIFNIVQNECYGAIIRNINGKIISTLERPVYCISNDGNHGISLNFSRLGRLRPGYGYDLIKDDTKNIKAPEDDGLWYFDLNNGNESLIVSLSTIKDVDAEKGMDNSIHYFNHASFSPKGEKIIAFHIWLKNNKRSSRLVLIDVRSTEIKVLELKGNVSHYNWVSDNKIILTVHEKESTKYYFVDINTSNTELIGRGILIGDGHPSFDKENNVMITDTYPNRLGYQKLMAYDFNLMKLDVIGKFYSSDKFVGENKCDLHPRLSNSGKYISIDTAFNDSRSMVIIKRL